MSNIPTQYRTPTDEDAKSRPVCEFSKNAQFTGSFFLKLMGVSECAYFVDTEGIRWRYCRMEVKP